MSKYTITTDACSVEIEASTADVAAAEFATSEHMTGVSTVAQLEQRIEELGGYGHMTDDSGHELFRIEA